MRWTSCANPWPGVGDAETLTRKQFDMALDGFGVLLQDVRRRRAVSRRRLEELARDAAKLGGMVRKLTAEKGKCAETDALIWVDALGATVLSHRRDFDLMMPWAGDRRESEIPRGRCIGPPVSGDADRSPICRNSARWRLPS